MMPKTPATDAILYRAPSRRAPQTPCGSDPPAAHHARPSAATQRARLSHPTCLMYGRGSESNYAAPERAQNGVYQMRERHQRHRPGRAVPQTGNARSRDSDAQIQCQVQDRVRSLRDRENRQNVLVATLFCALAFVGISGGIWRVARRRIREHFRLSLRDMPGAACQERRWRSNARARIQSVFMSTRNQAMSFALTIL